MPRSLPLRARTTFEGMCVVHVVCCSLLNVLRTRRVAWGVTIERLFAHYINTDYLKDEVFLKAAFLDPNVGPSMLEAYPDIAVLARDFVLRDLRVIVDERMRVERQSAAAAAAAAEAKANAAAAAAAASRSSQTASTTSFLPARRAPPPDVAAQLALARSQPAGHTGDDELASLTTKLWQASEAISKGAVIDPIAFYVTGDASKLTAARSLALHLFTIPAGEASSERVFSAAGWFDSARRRFAPKTLSALTYCRFNRAAQLPK